MTLSLSSQEEEAIQFHMQGADKTAAYKKAGYGGKSSHKTIQENACRLFKRSKVVARIEQLKKEIQDKVLKELSIDKEYVTSRILYNIQVAENKMDPASAFKGLDMLGKMYDLNEDKQNDRLFSNKERVALIENFKARMLDVTPKEEKE